jgi:hypothetical protein
MSTPPVGLDWRWRIVYAVVNAVRDRRALQVIERDAELDPDRHPPIDHPYRGIDVHGGGVPEVAVRVDALHDALDAPTRAGPDGSPLVHGALPPASRPDVDALPGPDAEGVHSVAFDAT